MEAASRSRAVGFLPMDTKALSLIVAVLFAFIPGIALADGVTPTSGTDGLFSVSYTALTPFSLYAPSDPGHTMDASSTYCTVSIPGSATCDVSAGADYGVWDAEENGGTFGYYDYINNNAAATSSPPLSYEENMFLVCVMIFFLSFPCWFSMFRKPYV